MTKTAIAWLRNDLRVSDSPALHAALRAGERVFALYIHEESDRVRAPGAAGRWWLHGSLEALGKDLATLGVTLLVRQGETAAVVSAVVEELEAGAVYWNRRYAPGECSLDSEIKTSLQQRGIEVHSFGANVLVEPWDIATGQGKPYSVFGPFLKALRAKVIPQPLGRPGGKAPVRPAAFDAHYREPHWAGKMAPYWQIGEEAAHQALAAFLDGMLDGYAEGRDFPVRKATSTLSPRLRFGEISPRQVWHAALAVAHADHKRQPAVDKFLSELTWRDFNYHQLYHRPDIAQQAMQPRYGGLRWRSAPEELGQWQKGRTGFPVVDAGMRELWETGFMQNRVRMLVASLLTKNLLIDWRLGEQWFWDCLLDADAANNPGNWQWIAGSGMDASPYFRIFNPVTQGERFDREGGYIRRWVPELAQLPDKWIQTPWAAPADILARAGVVLGTTYPQPMVDLKTSRDRALAAARQLQDAEHAL